MGAAGVLLNIGGSTGALMAALAGLASVGLWGGSSAGRPEPSAPVTKPPLPGLSLGEILAGLEVELGATGALYAYFSEEQVMRRMVVSAAAESRHPATLLSSDPLFKVMMDAEPQAFTLFEDAEALGSPRLQGCSTLAFPVRSHAGACGLVVLTSEQEPLGQEAMQHLRLWEPAVASALENAVLADRLERSRRENEAMLALARIVQGRMGGERLFEEAIVHIRHLTEARHAAILLRTPTGYTLCALASTGDETARQAFEAGSWDPREWPNLLGLHAGSRRSCLLDLQEVAMTPHERTWLEQVGPVRHELAVAFGEAAEASQGQLLLFWGDSGPIRIYETRLARSLGDVMALVAANRRSAEARRALEDERTSMAEVVRHQEALMRQLALDLRNSAYAISLIGEEIGVQAGHAEGIAQGVAALDRQVDFLCNLVAPSLGTAPIQGVEPSSLRSAIARAVETVAASCRVADLALRVEVPEEAGLLAAEDTVVQILGVLLDNARRFTPSGGRIRLWTAVTEAWTTVYVSDTGPGIPGAFHGRIGELGFQVDPSRGGQGAGLAMARRLMKEVGGMLGFTTSEGAGTTFYVTFPTTFWRSHGCDARS